MSERYAQPVECRMIGDFVDQGEVPLDLKVTQGEPVRPRLLTEVVESEPELAFTVLLKDGRVAVVRGHHLQHEPSTENGLEIFTVHQRMETSERVVAVFNSRDVAGIFYGDLRESRLSA